jgi:hypothetical protein
VRKLCQAVKMSANDSLAGTHVSFKYVCEASQNVQSFSKSVNCIKKTLPTIPRKEKSCCSKS